MSPNEARPARADTLVRRVELRNPFHVVDLPLVGRLCRAAYTPRRRFAKRFVGKPAKMLFRLAYGVLGLGGEGTLIYDGSGGERRLRFDARNIQFRALYLPQYAAGYETETSALLDVLLGPRDAFFDVGANWGYFALWAACRSGFDGAIHAFEPLAASFADMPGLVAQAGLEPRITCHHTALSDRDGDGVLAVDGGGDSGTARLSENAPGVRVTLAALDSLDLSPPATMKIDVEGHEHRVLAGARRTLEAARPFVIFESWREASAPETTLAPFGVLADLGYTFFAPTWWRATPAGGFAVEGPTDTLALVPMTPGQRFLLAEQMNVLACPVDRLDDLRRRFETP